jgi:hypothetical protein
MSWDDGERLMSLCHDVLNHIAQPQLFSFFPVGGAADAVQTILVTDNDPVELMTDC